MEHNKNRTVISNFGNAVTETIWAIGTSIAATAVPLIAYPNPQIQHYE